MQIGWLSQSVKRTLPLSYLDQPPDDEGIQGARLGIADNNTTGQFTGQSFELVESIVPESGDVAAAFRDLAATGIRLIVTDLDAPRLLTVAALPDAAHATILNTAAPDDRLRPRIAAPIFFTCYRAGRCWPMHSYTISSSDVGPTSSWLPGTPTATANLPAISVMRRRNSAPISSPTSRWTFIPGARRTDTGHFAIEAEVARFTQGVTYDVLVVADEEDEFGDDSPIIRSILVGGGHPRAGAERLGPRA